jgi:hypothetical protein
VILRAKMAYMETELLREGYLYELKERDILSMKMIRPDGNKEIRGVVDGCFFVASWQI